LVTFLAAVAVPALWRRQRLRVSLKRAVVFFLLVSVAMAAWSKWRDVDARLERDRSEYTLALAGWEQSGPEERAGHRVRITRPFWLGKYEVTQGQWQGVMGGNPSYFQGAGRDAPVEQVSWDDIQGFLKKALQRSGETVALPTEAQWEYACRAGTATPFHFGNTISTEQVNYDGNYPYGGTPKGHYRRTTISVGELPANAWGLHDMHGNVYEWCADWYASDYYRSTLTDDPTGPASGSDRVDRGGCWDFTAKVCRSANRGRSWPGLRSNLLGFRIAVPVR
jgi:formylglycine-generating enzyme required for sulfatase activity